MLDMTLTHFKYVLYFSYDNKIFTCSRDFNIAFVCVIPSSQVHPDAFNTYQQKLAV